MTYKTFHQTDRENRTKNNFDDKLNGLLRTYFFAIKFYLYFKRVQLKAIELFPQYVLWNERYKTYDEKSSSSSFTHH